MQIDDLGMNGEGIAHENKKAVFVPFYLPGEVVENGELLKKSEFRITPVCPYFKTCGGCHLQHLKYEETLKFKEDKIKNIFKKFKIKVKVLPCEPSPKIYNYRNKLTLKCDGEKLGLYKINTHEVVDITECKISSNEINRAIKIIREINLNNVREIILQNYLNNILITFKIIDKNYNNIIPLKDKLKEFKSYGIFVEYKNNTIFQTGDNYFLKEEFNIKYPFTNNSFYQINDEVKNIIYSDILANISTSDKVLDAYSGSGLLSACMARKAKLVTGVEIVPSATQNANKLKELNGLKNLQNINGDFVKELIYKINFNVCVLDPPRAGVNREAIELIMKKRPQKVIYLSCNPATLARDLCLFCERYNISSLKPYDMFPNTHHVETLAVLELKN